MDFTPAPLSITKRASMPAVQPGNNHAQKRLSTFGRSSSAHSSATASSSDATVLAPNSSLYAGWQNLDIPRVRPSTAQQSDRKVNRRGGLTVPTYNATHTPESHAEGQLPFPAGGHLQTQGRISQFFHSLDKKLIRHSTRGFSKRLSSNTRSPHPDTEEHSRTSHPPLKYSFAPPISVVGMEMHVDEPSSNFSRTETSIHITITTDVNMESTKYVQYSLGIDAIILLNMTCDSEMARVTPMAQVIVDKLKARDSFVVACVNFERHDFIDVLFVSSECRDLDVKRLLSEYSSAGKHPTNGALRDDDLLGDAVEAASRLFDTSEHSTPHIFLVSANHDTTLSTAYNPVVGLTTVTFEDHYDSGPSPRDGWHIHTDVSSDPYSARDFHNKVEKALCHIRSGFTAGTVTNLHVRLTPSAKCDIQVCGRTSIASLRPGETWKILVRVSVPEGESFDRLERDIGLLLRCSDVPGEVDDRGALFVATLRFTHSLQPSCSSKIVKSCRVPLA